MPKRYAPEKILFLKNFFRNVSRNPNQAQKHFLQAETGLTVRQLTEWFGKQRCKLKKNRTQTRNALLMLQTNLSSLFVESKQGEAASLIDKLILQVSDMPEKTAKVINPKCGKDIFKDDDKSLEEALELCDELIGSTEDDSFDEQEAYVLLSDEQGPDFCAQLYILNAMEPIFQLRSKTYELFKTQNCRKLY